MPSKAQATITVGFFAFSTHAECERSAIPIAPSASRLFDKLSHLMPSWVFGTNTIRAGQTQDWWLWWPGNPGFEVIGVQAITPGDELDIDSPGVQRNPDGSTTYFLSVINPSASDIVFHFRGSAP